MFFPNSQGLLKIVLPPNRRVMWEPWNLENTWKYASLGRPKPPLNSSQTLQNRAWSAPRRHFEQMLNLRRLKSRLPHSRRRHCGPTWLQVGGPRSSKIEAETRKKRCWKTTHFWHRFWKGSGLVLEGFLRVFLSEKWMHLAKTRFSRKRETYQFY